MTVWTEDSDKIDSDSVNYNVAPSTPIINQLPTPEDSPLELPKNATLTANETSDLCHKLELAVIESNPIEDCETQIIHDNSGVYKLSDRLQSILKKEPIIPAPVTKSLGPLMTNEGIKIALQNSFQSKNVYIRGLRPDTTDEILEGMCSRFGRIKSLKAILDLNTSKCKGYGFVEYFEGENANDCIIGLMYLGYQGSFAKKSLFERLMTLQDQNSANLYLSNLPANIDEKSICDLMHPYKVVSSKILKTAKNESRGVGFAQMQSREVAIEIINRLQNFKFEDGSDLKIRFADSTRQKKLKYRTSQRRMHRAEEYEKLSEKQKLGEESQCKGEVEVEPSNLKTAGKVKHNHRKAHHQTYRYTSNPSLNPESRDTASKQSIFGYWTYVPQYASAFCPNGDWEYPIMYYMPFEGPNPIPVNQPPFLPVPMRGKNV